MTRLETPFVTDGDLIIVEVIVTGQLGVGTFSVALNPVEVAFPP